MNRPRLGLALASLAEKTRRITVETAASGGSLQWLEAVAGSAAGDYDPLADGWPVSREAMLWSWSELVGQYGSGQFAGLLGSGVTEEDAGRVGELMCEIVLALVNTADEEFRPICSRCGEDTLLSLVAGEGPHVCECLLEELSTFVGS